jgi:cardiolipin synthase
MKGAEGSEGGSSAILTIPNLLSFARILLIPFFVYLIVHRPTTMAGLLMFGFVVATDWVDGYIARRTNSVSELGKVLDPVADRLAIAAGIIALIVRDAFPLWAGLLILVRDLAVLSVGAVVLAERRVRIEIRYIGKVATFSLMVAVGSVSWGMLGYPLAELALSVGWLAFTAGILEYYAAGLAYAIDLRRALAAR